MENFDGPCKSSDQQLYHWGLVMEEKAAYAN